MDWTLPLAPQRKFVVKRRSLPYARSDPSPPIGRARSEWERLTAALCHRPCRGNGVAAAAVARPGEICRQARALPCRAARERPRCHRINRDKTMTWERRQGRDDLSSSEDNVPIVRSVSARLPCGSSL
jgi:hypothetical protein